jgi:hypothetical protein
MDSLLVFYVVMAVLVMIHRAVLRRVYPAVIEEGNALMLIYPVRAVVSIVGGNIIAGLLFTWSPTFTWAMIGVNLVFTWTRLYVMHRKERGG